MRRLAALLVPLVALALASGTRAQPALTPPVALDGPSTGIGALSGLSVARDGSGGLAYLKAVAGVQHVFVSRLVGGAFAPPEQVDGALGGGSSQPVIAVGDNGLLLVAFINAGQLYVVTRRSVSAPYGAPQALASGASNPALAISIHAKAYLAFTVAGNGGHDVRSAYYHAGRWGLEPSSLNAVPGDDAGLGTGPPRVAAAGDGVGIVVWGEAGHVYSRRVWGVSPSVVFEQADVASLSGWSEVSADMPTVATGDDSSYAFVAFHELLSNGSAQQSRVLLNGLRGSLYGGPVEVDGLTTPGAEGAVQPQISLTEYNDGFITSGRDSSKQVFATRLGNGGEVQGGARVDSLQNVALPFAVPAAAGSYSALIAWQQFPGLQGFPEIRARYYDGTSFGAEMVASSPALGPTVAASGLLAAGDYGGDVAIAWVQGSAPQLSIVAALLYRPPGFFGPLTPAYVTSARPAFSWSPAREQWGPVTYSLSIDGALVGQTSTTRERPPLPLSNGPHTWQVTAVNQAGLATAARTASVWVDTVAPSAQFTLAGPGRVGSVLHLGVRYTDTPPPLPAGAGSGVSGVLVKWGDGTSSHIHHGAAHAYLRAGNYRLTVVVSDRAGNATTLTRRVRIRTRTG